MGADLLSLIASFGADRQKKYRPVLLELRLKREAELGQAPLQFWILEKSLNEFNKFTKE